MDVDPFKVEGKVDYDKLVEKFGVSRLTSELVERFERVTGRSIHPWIRRGHFFAHRDLELVLSEYEQGKQIYLYTGRGPSSESLHLGHLIPLLMTKYLQEAFKAVVVIQIADDEKYWYSQKLSYQDVTKMGKENIKDILSIGFDRDRTFIFTNRDYNQMLYPIVAEMAKLVTLNIIQKIFGFSEEANIGQIMWPLYQSAPAVSASFPHLFGEEKIRCFVVYAIDQDPYFRLTRDLTKRLKGKYPKPAALISKFLPPLDTLEGKMSASSTTPKIYLTDSEKVLRRKINRYIFTGGRDTKDEQERLGANIEVDVPCHYLGYFEMDDARLAETIEKYSKGQLLSGDVKRILGDCLWQILQPLQQRRIELDLPCSSRVNESEPDGLRE